MKDYVGKEVVVHLMDGTKVSGVLEQLKDVQDKNTGLSYYCCMKNGRADRNLFFTKLHLSCSGIEVC